MKLIRSKQKKDLERIKLTAVNKMYVFFLCSSRTPESRKHEIGQVYQKSRNVVSSSVKIKRVPSFLFVCFIKL